MAVKLSQSLKQTQSLMMTPQLQQAIKLLTLTHLEMTNVIAEEMVENPLLEEIGGEDNREENHNGNIDKSEVEYREETLNLQNTEATSEAYNDNYNENLGASVESPTRDDFDWNSYIDSYNSSSHNTPNMASSDPEDTHNYENIISKGMSLAEHLEFQLRMENLSEEEWHLSTLIIHNINDDGYLETSFDEIMAETKLERDEGLRILSMIQRLDPVGCGTHNLVECLLAQAKIAEERAPLLEKIICEHLDDLKNRDYAKICKQTGATEEQVKNTALLLQNFHPRPGRLVAPSETHYIVPDIYVVEMGGEFVVQVNDDGIPRLKISKLYQKMLKSGGTREKDAASDYVQEKLRQAMWLMKSIQNRQRTIYKVSEAIVRQQQDFFKKGPRFLKPMVLRDIAAEIGMHESTVSRVTSNKYMHTPIGMFELKYFFNGGVGGKNGGVDVSSEVLRLKIKEMIERENPIKPLSDQKIVELLTREDLEVARRTVAKYREAMGIETSARRKRKI